MAWNLKWNLLLAMISIVLTLVSLDFNLSAHMMQAEAFSEELAESLRTDEDEIRPHLERILQRSGERNTMLFTIPLAMLSVLLTVRLITDRMRDNRTRPSS